MPMNTTLVTCSPRYTEEAVDVEDLGDDLLA